MRTGIIKIILGITCVLGIFIFLFYRSQSMGKLNNTTGSETQVVKPPTQEEKTVEKNGQEARFPGNEHSYLVAEVDGRDSQHLNPGETALYPLFIFDRGQFKKPPRWDEPGAIHEPDEATYKTFWRDSIANGGLFELGSGGVKIADAKVRTVTKGAISYSGIKRVDITKKCEPCLAVNTSGIFGSRSMRREATAAELQAARTAVGAVLKRDKIQFTNLSDIRIKVDAVDVEGDGTFELIVGCSARTPVAKGGISLLMMLMSINASYSEAFVKNYSVNDPIEAETMTNAKFLDVLDIDKDGVSEVITTLSYVDSGEVVIYKRGPEKWAVAF